MSIEEEINAIIDNSPNYDPHVTYPHAELCAYVRVYAVQELEKIKDKIMTQDVIGRSLGQVVIDSVDYIDEAIARLNEEFNQSNN